MKIIKEKTIEFLSVGERAGIKDENGGRRVEWKKKDKIETDQHHGGDEKIERA